MSTKQNVLVVGGGGAGVRAFKQLSKQLDHSTHELILITPRAYDISWPAMVRAVVTEEGRLESTDVGACAPYGACAMPQFR
jgi:NADH dehydrogenase FAD-containing subunit